MIVGGDELDASIRCKCAGSAPRFARRFFARSRFFSSSTSALALTVSSSSRTKANWSSLSRAEARPPQHGDAVMKLFVGGVKLVRLFDKEQLLSPLVKNQRAQGVDIVGKRIRRSSDHDGSFADLRSTFS